MLEEKYYSVSEVAKRFGLAVSTINKWINKGELKAIRLGKVWRIPESALQEFIRDNQKKD